jgi:hypothetical protein
MACGLSALWLENSYPQIYPQGMVPTVPFSDLAAPAEKVSHGRVPTETEVVENHTGVPIHQGDRFQTISVDIAVDHLTESERRKCLEMEVIATAEADEEVAETRKTVAQFMASN